MGGKGSRLESLLIHSVAVLILAHCTRGAWIGSTDKVRVKGGELQGEVVTGNYSNGTCPPTIVRLYHCLKCQPCSTEGQSPVLCPPYTDPDSGMIKRDLMCNTTECVDGYASGPLEILCVSAVTMFVLMFIWWTAIAFACCVCFCGFGCSFRARFLKYRRWRTLRVQKPEAWVKAGRQKLSADGPYPSGLWRGHFTHGARFEVPDFEFTFAVAPGRRPGAVAGRGWDAGGRFELEGTHSTSTRRVAFKKRYEVGSKDAHGRDVPEDVQSKVAEFRGEPAGDSVSSGIAGRWFISGAERSGRFSLWPAEDGDPVAAGSFLELAAESFCVTEGGPCVVCYDGFVDTKFAPCGHVAVCRLCAEQLEAPLRCPICRSDVREVVYCSSGRSAARSTVFALADSSARASTSATASS